jgi:hypothetical protein
MWGSNILFHLLPLQNAELQHALMELYSVMIENAVQFGCASAKQRKVSLWLSFLHVMQARCQTGCQQHGTTKQVLQRDQLHAYPRAAGGFTPLQDQTSY